MSRVGEGARIVSMYTLCEAPAGTAGSGAARSGAGGTAGIVARTGVRAEFAGVTTTSPRSRIIARGQPEPVLMPVGVILLVGLVVQDEQHERDPAK